MNETKPSHETHQGIMVVNELVPCHELQRDFILENKFEVEEIIDDYLNPTLFFESN
jgi:hypothetical protein